MTRPQFGPYLSTFLNLTSDRYLQIPATAIFCTVCYLIAKSTSNIKIMVKSSTKPQPSKKTTSSTSSKQKQCLKITAPPQARKLGYKAAGTYIFSHNSPHCITQSYLASSNLAQKLGEEMTELDAQTDGTDDLYPEVGSDAELAPEELDELEDDPDACRMSKSSEGMCCLLFNTLQLDKSTDDTFLIPKLNRTASKAICPDQHCYLDQVLSGGGLIMVKTGAPSLSHTSSAALQPPLPFAALDTPIEYYSMIKKYLHALSNSTKGKSGAVDILMKSQIEPIQALVRREFVQSRIQNLMA
jgi:hypothetical protein